MMEFHEFSEYVKDNIRDYLPPEYRDAKVELNEVIKNNGKTLHGLCIRTQESQVAPNIYLEGLFEEYTRGLEPELALERVSKMYLQYQEPDEAIRNVAENFQDPAFIKEHVVVALVNADKNAEMLKNTPHTMKEDLAIIYKVFLGKAGDSVGTVTVKDEHMKCWGMSLAELHECAMKNSRDLMPVKVEDLSSLLSAMGFPMDMPSVSDKEMMYVISNEQRINGAAGILYSDCLKKLSEKLGTDLFILPSSIHETIAISTESTNAIELAKIVREVNSTTVSSEEQLSDHVYRYDAKTGVLSLADTTKEELICDSAKEQKETMDQEPARARHHR